jgi:peptidyl-dipeptidase A
LQKELFKSIQKLPVFNMLFEHGKILGCNITFCVLLGNMWAQNWEALLDLLLPGQKITNLTSALRTRNYTITNMVRHAEDFYTSLGLEPMTHSFWIHSQLEKSSDSNGTCHGTAANMYQPGDYRYTSCNREF